MRQPQRDRRFGDAPATVAPLLQHLLIAGPVFGFLASAWQYMVWLNAPDRRDAATGHVIRCTRAWHGKVLDHYYITAAQARIEEVLAIPVACWMILVIGGLVAFGIRIDAARWRARRSGHPGRSRD